MNHKQKIQLARKLRTPTEERERKPIFLSAGWLRRKDAITLREKKRREAAFKRKYPPILPQYQG